MSCPNKTNALSILSTLINDPTGELRDSIVDKLKEVQSYILGLSTTIDIDLAMVDGHITDLRSAKGFIESGFGYAEEYIERAIDYLTGLLVPPPVESFHSSTAERNIANLLSTKPRSVQRSIALIDEMMARPDHDPALAFVRRVLNGENPNVPE
jgi:hypothetical protein